MKLAHLNMIVGAFGGSAFGISQTTYDIDILVDLREQDFESLFQRFPLPRYYADPEMMRDSVNLGIMFNIIDTGEGVKADLVPLRREPDYETAFERRVRREFVAPGGESFEAWVAQPTDIIVGKLKAWDEGRLNKHPADIFSMLVFDLSGFSDISINFDLISVEAVRISLDVAELWRQLVERAKSETTERKD